MLPDGWWRTGDIAMLDSKYDVYCINGRSKECLNHGSTDVQIRTTTGMTKNKKGYDHSWW